MPALGLGMGLPFARRGTVAAVPYPLSFAELGIVANGYVYDGIVSRFYTDSARTTLCTTSGSDPIGAVEDLSGNGNHSIQVVSGNKPVYFSDGTIQSVKHGMISGVSRYMLATDLPPPSNDVYGPRATYAVVKVISDSSGVNLYLATRLKITGGVVFSSVMKIGNDASGVFRMYTTNGNAGVSGGPATGGAPGVVKGMQLDGANAGIYANSTISFTGGSTSYGNPNPSADSEYWATFGMFGDGETVAQTCFLFDTTVIPTAGQDATIKSYIEDNFAAWAGN